MMRVAPRHIIEISILVVFSVGFSSLTLWLVESWLKYLFFIFEILTIMVLYLSVQNRFDLKIMIRRSPFRLNLGLTSNLLLILMSLSLLVFNVLGVVFARNGVLNVTFSGVEVIFALLSTSILCGYALLNVCRLTRCFSTLETIVMSCVVSYAFTGFMTLAFIVVSERLRTIIILGSFVALGLISILRHSGDKDPLQKSFARNVDVLPLSVALAFYLISIWLIYPGLALFPGTDISRHYAESVVLGRTPDLYSGGYMYVQLHLYESTFLYASHASIPAAQTALVTLVLIIPLAYYAMAKSYLGNMDARLPAISTIFYSMFSGFAWIYLAKLKLDFTGQSYSTLIALVNDMSYNGVVYSLRNLWFVPEVIGYFILIIQLLLIRKSNLSGRSFVALFSFLTIASFLTHAYEPMIFMLFLGVYAVFSRNRNIRLDDALLASIISYVFVYAFYVLLRARGAFVLFLFSEYIFFRGFLLLPAVFLALIYTVRQLTNGKRLIIRTKLDSFVFYPIARFGWRALLYTLTFVYVLGFVGWLGGISSIHSDEMALIGKVPWFIYPVILGVAGFLSILSLYYMFHYVEGIEMLFPLVALTLFLLIFGRAITFLNLSLNVSTGYSEKRIPGLLFLCCTVLAPVAVVKGLDSLRKHRSQISGVALSAFIIGTIVLYGTQSAFLGIEHWNSAVNPGNLLGGADLDAMGRLNSIYELDPHAFGISPSSNDLLTFAAPPYNPDPTIHLYTAEGPELPLVILKAHDLAHPYLYMSSRDYELVSKYPNSWMTRHLLPILPTVYAQDHTAIYNISSVSFPQSDSTTTLIVPLDTSVAPEKPWFYAYDILSLGNYNYSVAYDLDPLIFSHKSLVLSVDPPKGDVVRRNFTDDFRSRQSDVVSGTWQYTGNGLLAGKVGEKQDAIVIYPMSGENFNASVTFRVLDGDPKGLGYVSMIYDWKDKNNMKYGGLTFDPSGDLSAYVNTVQDGTLTGYPAWPGYNTHLKWHLGDSYNLTVSVRADMATLYLNGTKYVTAKTYRQEGRLGIRMTGFYQVLFSYFKIDASAPIQIRAPTEYLDYVREGGRLVILNTNGYGYFADLMFNASNSVTKTREISGSTELLLPEEISVPQLHLKYQNISATANYRIPVSRDMNFCGNRTTLVPYSAQQKLGLGRIIYVNLFPLMSGIGSSANPPAYYNLLGKLLRGSGVSLDNFTYTPFAGNGGTLRELSANGEIGANASTMIFSPRANIGELKISRGGVEELHYNVMNLRLSSFKHVWLTGENATMAGGGGFYSAMSFTGGVNVNLGGGSITLKLENGTSLSISSVDNFTVTGSKPVTLYVKQPLIKMRGRAVLKEVYGVFVVDGVDYIGDGTVVLKPYISDTYTWLNMLNIKGNFKIDPPLKVYDELASLPQTILWIIVAVPILLALSLIGYSSRPTKRDFNSVYSARDSVNL
jgi:hypothetical protein